MRSYVYLVPSLKQLIIHISSSDRTGSYKRRTCDRRRAIQCRLFRYAFTGFYISVFFIHTHPGQWLDEKSVGVISSHFSSGRPVDLIQVTLHLPRNLARSRDDQKVGCVRSHLIVYLNFIHCSSVSSVKYHSGESSIIQIYSPHLGACT